MQKSAGKFLASIFWIDHLPKSQTTKAGHYSSLLVQMKDILKKKRRARRKVTKGVVFLYDNSPAHRHLQSRRNWHTWASNALNTHPILRF
jgi:hypothetical protein